jgi:hypothetical protein
MSNTRYFKVTLTLDFTRHHNSVEDLDFKEDSFEDESKNEYKERVKDWMETDALYGTQEQIEAFVKSFDPLGFVEYIPEQEVVSAEWHEDDFKISFIVKTDDDETTAEEIIHWLEMTSLEDGEYESCGTSGWTVKTLAETMEYGLTDFRRNPIVVEEVEAPENNCGGVKLTAPPA